MLGWLVLYSVHSLTTMQHVQILRAGSSGNTAACLKLAAAAVGCLPGRLVGSTMHALTSACVWLMSCRIGSEPVPVGVSHLHKPHSGPEFCPCLKQDWLSTPGWSQVCTMYRYDCQHSSAELCDSEWLQASLHRPLGTCL